MVAIAYNIYRFRNVNEIKPKQEVIQPKQKVIQPKQEVIQPKKKVIQPKQEMIQRRQEVIQPLILGKKGTIDLLTTFPEQKPPSPSSLTDEQGNLVKRKRFVAIRRGDSGTSPHSGKVS